MYVKCVISESTEDMLHTALSGLLHLSDIDISKKYKFPQQNNSIFSSLFFVTMTSVLTMQNIVTCKIPKNIYDRE